MKKILLTLAVAGASLFSATSFAQMPPPPPRGPMMERPHGPPPRMQRRKVWVPAHREHGRYVRGHYAWR